MSPWEYALLAQEAYTAKPDIGREDSASRAIVREVDDGLAVAFPGTNNLPCVEADIDLKSIHIFGVGNVFQGFWKAWDAIAEEVIKTINGRPVVFVGHSLGAAMAILAAADVSSLGQDVLAVWGFEPPKVATDWELGQMLIDVPLHLYRNGGDVVPSLPLGGEHPRALIQLGSPAFPNVGDHDLSKVIANLEPSNAP